MANTLPKIALGAWAWGNDGITFFYPQVDCVSTKRYYRRIDTQF